MTDNLFIENDRQDFLEMTSESAIRSAAYPLDEWVAAGGTLLGYGQVTNQDAPPICQSYTGGLLGAAFSTLAPKSTEQDAQQRAANIEAHKQKIEAHPFYAWLVGNLHFVNAKNTFDKRIQSENSICMEFASFRFMRMVAMYICWQLLAKRFGYNPVRASKKELSQAKGHAEKLEQLFETGVQLNDWVSQNYLKKLLEQLRLEIQATPRKEKISPFIKSVNVWNLLQWNCIWLLVFCRLQSSTIWRLC